MLFLLGCHLTWQHIWEFWWSFLRLFYFCFNRSVKHNAAEQTAIFCLNWTVSYNLFMFVKTSLIFWPPYQKLYQSIHIVLSLGQYDLKLFQNVFVGSHQRRWDMVHWHLSSIPVCLEDFHLMFVFAGCISLKLCLYWGQVW